ncbi:hypothetical protein RHGRI_033821 [Rhododendron griersonianum]|uniref:FAR1 domain-containing protein n=1 Tax=Rhododendron griersonianum TaxID=479676 RepID=A0AAV6HY91_9ERIC|nr:hypothetical protein RHGRI_033821 [Rhododendron griersonianum]
MMKQQSAPKQALKQLPDVFSLWLFLSHSRLRRRRASCLRGEFQSCRKLDFEDDGDLLEINVVSVVSGDEGEPNEFQNSTPTMNHIDSIHSRIAKESIPQLDMEFGTEEAAYQFYNAYAYKAGFSIRRSKEHIDTSGQITSRTFCCSCEGKRGKDKRDANVKIHRPETSDDTRPIYFEEVDHAKSGNTTSTSASSIQDDPKAMMGIRYKELCRLHTHLATRAAESEKAYEIALDGLHKILEEVETILGGVEIHETFLETSHEQNDVVEDDAIIHDEGTGNKVKGLKVKERTNGKSSKRPKSALEKATRNKRKPQAKPSSDGANYISGPVGQTMFVSPQYFTQQHNTQVHNPRLDVPLERNTLTPLSHLSLLTQQSQLGNKRKPQAKASSNGANSINGPVRQTMFVSPQYFTQQHNTQIHNPRLDVPHLSLVILTQQSQLGQDYESSNLGTLYSLITNQQGSSNYMTTIPQGRSPHGYEATYFHSFQDNSQ